MSSELEPVLDRLAADLDRQVVLEGADFEVLAYSRKQGTIDQVRVDTILSRHAPVAVRRWLRGRGIEAAEGPLRIDAAPRLGMLARICVPVRADRGELLGALWCIDSDDSITPEQLRAAEHVTPLVAATLLRGRESAASDRSARQNALRRLLLGADDEAAAARAELERDQMLEADGPVSVHLLQRRPDPAGRATGHRDDRDDQALRTALERVRCGLRSRRCGYFVADGEGVFVCAEPAADQVAEKLLHAARQATRGVSLVVAESGIGRPEDVRELLDQARQAARVARVIERFHPVARWDQLGVYQLLSALQDSSEGASPAAHRGLEALFAADGRGSLVETLECYLDNGGDIKATAGQLALHRTSLYYRLERIEELAAVDVRSGEDRLALHLGLRLARLRGTYPPAGTLAA